ncbi:MAG TPA: phasin family protein [Stellaceae bacterium]|nr:phasin family protein [Stellaceae bacterium]
MKSAVGPLRPPYAGQLGGMVAIFEELAIFGGERLDRTLATGQALSQCRNPVEAFAVQMQFACNTAAHYAAESLKLMRLASAAWSGSWNPV